MTTRVLPPADGLHNTISIFGRTYTCAADGFLDVPDDDAAVMTANGWQHAGHGGSVGATAARPAWTKNERGRTFLDTTLGYLIIWDGQNWRNPTTGAKM